MTTRATTMRSQLATGFFGLTVAATLLLQPGCSERVAPAHSETVMRDSAGVAIVEHPSELPQRGEWAVRLDGALRLSDEFYQIRGAIRLRDGGVVVADGGSMALRFFGADGSPAGFVGREGEGPGEFRDLTYIGRWPGDSILVWDWELRRLSVFDEEGRFGRSFEPEVTNEVPFANIRGVHGDGSLLANGLLSSSAQSGRQRRHSPAYHFRSDGSFGDVLSPTFSSESYFEFSDDGGLRVVTPLFAYSTVLHAGPDVLVEASNDSFELRIYTPSGEPQRYVRRVGEAPTVTGDLRRAALEEALETMESSPERAQRRQILAGMEVPDRLPAFGRVHVDRTNHLWVEEYAPWRQASVWLVFASDGSFVARAEVPQRLVPVDVGAEFFLGVRRDEFGVEEVVLAEINR